MNNVNIYQRDAKRCRIALWSCLALLMLYAAYAALVPLGVVNADQQEQIDLASGELRTLTQVWPIWITTYRASRTRYYRKYIGPPPPALWRTLIHGPSQYQEPEYALQSRDASLALACFLESGEFGALPAGPGLSVKAKSEMIQRTLYLLGNMNAPNAAGQYVLATYRKAILLGRPLETADLIHPHEFMENQYEPGTFDWVIEIGCG